MNDEIIVRAPGQDLADSMDPTFSLEDAEIDSLLTEAETRMRESASSSATAIVKKHRVPKLETSQQIKPYIHKGLAGTASITDAGKKANVSSRTIAHGKSIELPFMRVDDPLKVEKEKKEKKDKTAGPSWYNMPATEVTPQIKRDLQMIKLRNVLDPHKHFKGDDWKGKLPKYFQMGTLIEGPTEFYSARLNNKERKKSIVDEIMSNSSGKSRFRKKYDEIQAKKKSGKKEFYKKLKAKRSKGRF
ncbi:hypothetical protein H072_322 [Dactylellina haptotyla CBS 200.50]|uniref:Fcf2 pre-rRNA processing C-terminal domain-containing protein n=1 Tax=Dactylellina haptotyla (strain CBS 200.50) TaxID=1284197 RepID=S8AXI0_DACHA|nr:hypothetical protein H072_322 [Dactylellina haptotyla CBS 200.50]